MRDEGIGKNNTVVIPGPFAAPSRTEPGIHFDFVMAKGTAKWIPAFAGMTSKDFEHHL
jgi:hypothetical protein